MHPVVSPDLRRFEVGPVDAVLLGDLGLCCMYFGLT